MATILRVKRRLEDNPQDALVLMCKRIKTGEEEISPSLFVFRGTVDNQETTQVKKLVPKLDVKHQSSRNVTDIIEKIRKQRKEVSSESRYEVVNCSRGLTEDNSEDIDDLFDLVDLQRANDKEENLKYAYDLYTSPRQDFDISMLNDIVCIENYESDLVFGSYRDDGQAVSDDNDDDEDSNDENNWRNEYPDSDPSTIDEEDMIRAVEMCDIEDNLSSDSGDHKIYDQPSDLFNEDVKRYGRAYAEYKAKAMADDPKTNRPALIHCSRDLDEESIDGYKDDSDDGFYYGKTDEQHSEHSDSSNEYTPD